jgi:hypothetical protein
MDLLKWNLHFRVTYDSKFGVLASLVDSQGTSHAAAKYLREPSESSVACTVRTQPREHSHPHRPPSLATCPLRGWNLSRGRRRRPGTGRWDHATMAQERLHGWAAQHSESRRPRAVGTAAFNVLTERGTGQLAKLQVGRVSVATKGGGPGGLRLDNGRRTRGCAQWY